MIFKWANSVNFNIFPNGGSDLLGSGRTRFDKSSTTSDSERRHPRIIGRSSHIFTESYFRPCSQKRPALREGVATYKATSAAPIRQRGCKTKHDAEHCKSLAHEESLAGKFLAKAMYFSLLHSPFLRVPLSPARCLLLRSSESRCLMLHCFLFDIRAFKTFVMPSLSRLFLFVFLFYGASWQAYAPNGGCGRQNGGALCDPNKPSGTCCSSAGCVWFYFLKIPRAN